MKTNECLLGRSETSENAENTDAEMNEVEVKIQTELDRTEIVQTEKSRDSHERINRSESQPEASSPAGIFAKPGGKSDHPTQEVEQVVRRRKREIEHFMPEESGNADNNQNETAQNDVEFCKRSFHWEFTTSTQTTFRDKGLMKRIALLQRAGD